MGNGILKNRDISDKDIRAVRPPISGDIAIVTATADQAKTLGEHMKKSQDHDTDGRSAGTWS